MAASAAAFCARAACYSTSVRNFITSSRIQVSCVYNITLTTGDVFGAGTDAQVYIRAVGEKGSIDEICLKTKKGDLERGMSNSYTFSANDVGHLQKLIIRHDSAGIAPAWYLEKANIKDGKGRSYKFKCFDWLTKENDGIKLLREENYNQNTREVKLERSQGTTDATTSKFSVDKTLEIVAKHVARKSSSDKETFEQFDETFQDQSSNAKADGLPTNFDFDHTPSTRHAKLISPAVRNLLESYDINMSKISSSGPNGIILKGDVLQFMTTKNITERKMFPPEQLVVTTIHPKPSVASTGLLKPTSSRSSEETLTRERRQIPGVKSFQDRKITEDERKLANSITENKFSVPHIYLNSKCSVDNFLATTNTLTKVFENDITEFFLARILSLTIHTIPFVRELMTNIDVSITSPSGAFTIEQCNEGDFESLLERKKDIENPLPPCSITMLKDDGVAQLSAVLKHGVLLHICYGGVQLSVSSNGVIKKSVIISLSCDRRMITEETAAFILEKIRYGIENPFVVNL